MKTITFEPVLAAFLISGGEIVLIVAAMLVFLVMVGGVVAVVLRLRRRNDRRDTPPQIPPAAPTRRVCQGCGKEISADAPQGLCPTCLMNVALGSEGGNPAGSGERKPAPSPADIARHFPHLEIIELLGQGGMGAVYKARHRNLDRMVALKILPPHSATDAGFAERFNREARALAKLSHPNIVGVYDFGQTGNAPVPADRSRRREEADQASTEPSPPPHVGGYHYLIMEYVDGLNLRQLEQAGKLPPREALQIIPQICEALQFAHDEGIVHRDIKPENVLLDKKGRVKIADFGLARILGREPESFRLTGAKDFMGTPHYMAPEQIEHPQTVDHRADIYSLGVVFYEMLTGELPLGRFAPPSSRMRGVQIDVRLDEVVLRALEKEPERRYQHASEVKTDVETITGKPELAAPKVARADATRLHAQVRKAAFGLLIVAALHLIVLPLIAICVGWLRSPTPAPRPELVVAVILFNTLLSGFIFYGGRKMERLESYRLAVAASILLLGLTIGNLAGVAAGKSDNVVFLTPGFLFDLLLGVGILAPGDIAGIPMGIWALVILSKPEVKAAFARAALSTSTSAPPTQAMKGAVPPDSARKLLAHLTWALPTAALIVALGILTKAPRRAPVETPVPSITSESTDSPTPTAALTTRQAGELEFRLIAADGDTRTPADELADPSDRTGQQKLRVLKEVLLDSSAIASARLTTSQAGLKEINVVLKGDAAQKFADITAANIGRRLAIVWRGRVLSAPVIRTKISSPISVTGAMSDAESLVLLDLLNYKAGNGGATSFGPVMERVLHDPDDKRDNETLSLRTGALSSVLGGVSSDFGGRIHRLVASQGDLFAEYDDFVSSRWALITVGLKLSDLSPRQWENAAVSDVNVALETPTVVSHVERSGATLYLLPDGLLPMAFAFQTRENDRGLLQITSFTDNPRGVKIRYKLVRAAASIADYVNAATALNAMRGPLEALESAFDKSDLELAQTLVPTILDKFHAYNPLVRGTGFEIPQGSIDVLEMCNNALKFGDLVRAKTLFESSMKSIDSDLIERMDKLAAQQRQENEGSSSNTTRQPTQP